MGWSLHSDYTIFYGKKQTLHMKNQYQMSQA
jgi:hypothetical protein